MTRRHLPSFKSSFKVAWAIIICTGCAIFIWRHFNWTAVATSLAKIDYAAVVPVCFLLILAIFAIRTFRWITVANLEYDLATLGTAYLYVSGAIALGLVTPLQSGEVAKIWLSRRFSAVPLSSSVSALLIERVLDVMVLVVIFCGAGLIVRPSLYLLFGTIVACAGICSLNFVPIIASQFGLKTPLHRLSILRFCLTLLLTVLSLVLTTVLWDVALKAVGINLDAYNLIALISGAILSTIASLMPGGLGFTDLSVYAILVAQGAAPQMANVGTVILRLLTPLMLFIATIPILIAVLISPRRKVSALG